MPGWLCFCVVDGGVIFRGGDAVMVLPGVVRRSESFGRLGSPETILGRVEDGPEKGHKKKKTRKRERRTKDKRGGDEGKGVQQGRRRDEGVFTVSCRVVSYRVVQKEVEGWKEVGEGRKRSQEQGARSQEPGALRGARTRRRKGNPPNRKLLYKADKSAWKRRAGARNRGNSRNACMGKLGPDAEQPFSLSQPNREELCHLSLAVWGSLGIWDSGSVDWIRAHSNSVPAARVYLPG